MGAELFTVLFSQQKLLQMSDALAIVSPKLLSLLCFGKHQASPILSILLACDYCELSHVNLRSESLVAYRA